jgi:hypothetical protein
MRQVVLHCKVHCSAFVATLRIELNSFVDLAFLFEVLGTLDLNWLRGLKGHHHHLLVHTALLGESNGVVESRRTTVEHNSLPDVVDGLVVTSHIEASLRVVGVVSDTSSVLNVTYAAEQTDTAAEVLSLSVEVKGILSHFLRL